MNTPELKAGQRFLSRLEADNEITEVTVKQATADGAFIKCSWSYRVVQSAFAAYDDRTQWFAAGELSVLHVLENDAEPPKKTIVETLRESYDELAKWENAQREREAGNTTPPKPPTQ